MCDGLDPPPPICLDGTPVTRIPDPDPDSFDVQALDRSNDSVDGGCDPLPDIDVYPSNNGRVAPSTSSSLDALETSRGLASDLPLPSPAAVSRPLCSGFRHSGWQDRRARTLRALTAAGASPQRLDRFTRCGDVAWVLQSTSDPSRYRLAANRCRDRMCVPCANEHRSTVCRNLREACAGKVLRLLTLTLKSREIPLADLLRILNESWAVLRREMKREHGLLGGVAFLEITLNPTSRLWHPHLHVIFEGQWTPKAWIRERWLAITGDSFIVDVKPIADSNHAAGYVAKYASKTLSASVLNDPERMCEAVQALTGLRAFATFGSWTKLHLSRHPESDVGWEPLRPLYLVILDARSGDTVARAILQALSRSNADDPLTLLHDLPP